MLSLRANREILESLRVTLQKLEKVPDCGQFAEERASVKRILADRIAEFEQARTRKPSDLFPCTSVAVSRPHRIAMNLGQLGKLN